MMKQSLFWRQAARFLAAGGTSTLLDFLIYMSLGNFLPSSFAKLISMCCACTFSFFLNRRWTFEDRRKIRLPQVAKYVLAQAVNIFVNVSVNALLLHALEGKRIPAFIGATGAAVAVNFLLQKFFVFRKEPVE